MDSQHNSSDDATQVIPRTLREQESKFAELLHENFNLKMRVSYLEDKLLRLGGGVMAFASEELEAEVIQLRKALGERDHQLSEQHAAMVRGNQAIDMLTQQLRAAHTNLPQGGQVHAKAVGQSAVQAAQRRIGELEAEVDTLKFKLQKSQYSHQRNVCNSEQWKQCYQQTLEYLKREGVKALHEVGHLRDLNKSKDEMLARSRELLEDAHQQKRLQGNEYVSRLKRFSEEAKQLGEQEERLHANYQADYVRLERDWMNDQTRLLKHNEFFREEITALRSELSKERLKAFSVQVKD